MRKKYDKIKIEEKLILLLILPLIFTNLPFISALKNNNHTFPESSLTMRLNENINRGLVVYNISENEVYVSWRLLDEDNENIVFDIYRSDDGINSIKLNSNPIDKTTDYIDDFPGVTLNSKYWVVPYVNMMAKTPSENATIVNNQNEQYISISLQDNSQAAKIGIGDLNGDGSYDYIIRTPNEGTDPANSYWFASENTSKIEAYLSNGTYLWTYDMGWDIEMGSWYTPYIVYDLDCDGKAEVIVKSGENDGDHRDLEGRVSSGPEFVKILDGMTGEEITRAPWISRWNEDYKNLARNQLGIAYLDGINPYIIVSRGTYERMNVITYSYKEQELTEVWYWNSDFEWGRTYYSQGAHTMTCYDIDEDGKDEIILGSCVLDEDGNGLWSTGLTHCDLAYVGDIDPTHPGLEIYYSIEGTGPIDYENGYGMSMFDAKTGEFLWGLNIETEHMHTGFVSDITEEFNGSECFSAEKGLPERYLLGPQGDIIANESEFDYYTSLRAVYWDSNLQRELINNNLIWNYDSQSIYSNSISGLQLAFVDIFGDWREEIITSLNGELRIYFTTIPAEDRRISLIQDPLYRNTLAHISMGYTPLLSTSYCLASPNTLKSSSSNWVSNYNNSLTFSTKFSAIYRKYYYVIIGYCISLAITAIFLFLWNNILWFIDKLKIIENKIIIMIQGN